MALIKLRGKRERKLGLECLESRHLLAADGFGGAELVVTIADDEDDGNTSPDDLSLREAIRISEGSVEWFAEVNANQYVDPPISLVNWQGRQTKAVEGQWVVQFDPIVDLERPVDAAELLAASGAPFDVIRGLGSEGLVLVSAKEISFGQAQRHLDTLPGVVHFEPNLVGEFLARPNDPLFDQQWGLRNTGQKVPPGVGQEGKPDADIDAPQAWNIETGSEDVVVALIDTGVDLDHPDLIDNLWTNPGEIPGNGLDDDGNSFIDDIHGVDLINGDGDPSIVDPGNNHGTTVAGVIGAQGNNGLGVTGVAWNVDQMHIRVHPFLSWEIVSMNYILSMESSGVNVRVINMSWKTGCSNAFNARLAVAEDAGILVAAAAGNADGLNLDDFPTHCPAHATRPFGDPLENVIIVSSVDNQDNPIDYYGPTSVDLCAPGQDILTTTVQGTGSVAADYEYFSGTSLATPHVSGAAALLWSLRPQATIPQIREALLDTVDHIEEGDWRTVTGGRLNVNKALAHLLKVTTGPGGDPTLRVPAAGPDDAADPDQPVSAPAKLVFAKDAAADVAFANTTGALVALPTNRWESRTALAAATPRDNAAHRVVDEVFNQVAPADKLTTEATPWLALSNPRATLV